MQVVGLFQGSMKQVFEKSKNRQSDVAQRVCTMMQGCSTNDRVNSKLCKVINYDHPNDYVLQLLQNNAHQNAG